MNRWFLREHGILKPARAATARSGSLLVALFIAAAFMLTALTVVPFRATAATLYVGGAGPGNYTKIQAAIDAAAPGSTVFVYGGRYYEGISIGKPLSLIGQDMNTTVIDAGAVGTVVSVNANGVTIEGFNVTNGGLSSGHYAISLSNCDDCRIANVIFSNNTDTLGLYQSDRTIITDNTFLDNDGGVRVDSSNGDFIANNTFDARTSGGISLSSSKDSIIADNTIQNGGISIDSSTNMTLTGNRMVDFGISMKGQFIQYWNTHTIDASNKVHGGPVYYWRNVTGGSVPMDAGEAILANASGVAVENHTMANSSVILGFSSGNRIVNNTAAGISLYSSDSNYIADNNCSDTMKSANHIYRRSGPIIVGAISGTIALEDSNSNMIVHNNASGNWIGTYLYYSDNNTIANNTLFSNEYTGISVQASKGVMLFNNTVHSTAIQLSGSSAVNLTGNTIINGTISIEGDSVDDWNSHSIDTSNTVDGRPVCYWKNVVGGTVPLDAGQVILANATKVVVEDQIATDRSLTVDLGFSDGNLVANNTVSGNRGGGVHLSTSNSNVVDNNSNFGIGTVGSIKNIIAHNTVVNSSISLTSSEALVANNTISGGPGIQVTSGSDRVFLDDNILDGTWYGLRFTRTSYVRAQRNSIKSSLLSAVYLEESKSIRLIGNTMVGSGVLMSGSNLENWGHLIDTSNTVNGKPVYYWWNVVGGEVPLGAGEVILAYCKDVSVRGQHLDNTTAGLQIGFSSRTIVADTTSSSNRWMGAMLTSSDNSTVLNSTFSNTLYGLYIWYSNDNVFSGNKITNNTVSYQGYGGGIGVLLSGFRNTFSNNSISGNIWGFTIGFSDGKRLFHNNIVGNLHNFLPSQGQESDPGINQWDNGYPDGGNYWSDYLGADDCSGPNQDVCPDPDGIGDVPYAIDHDSGDRYPLMSPVLPNAAPVIHLTVPVGGERWSGGYMMTISWIVSDAEDPDFALTVNLYFSSDNGTSWSALALGLPGDNMTYLWSEPLIDTEGARIKVCATDTERLTTCEISGPFTIDSNPPSIWSNTPANGAFNVSLVDDIHVVFDGAVNRTSAENAFSMSPDPGGVSLHWQADASGRDELVVSHDPLQVDVDYVISFSTGIHDTSDPGNRPFQPLVLRFSTAKAPTAIISARDHARAGDSVTFDASGSAGNVASYVWTITDSQGRTIAVLTGSIVTYPFKDPGRYRVSLTVTDNMSGLSDTKEMEITIEGDSFLLPLLFLVAGICLIAGIIGGTEAGRVPLMTMLLAAVNRKKFGEEDDKFSLLVLGYIIGNPGANYTSIRERLKLNNGTLSWHLMKLEKAGKIRSRIRGTWKRYYPADMPAENGGELHEIQKRLLQTVGKHPGMLVGLLAEELGVSRQLTLYHLREMSQRGIISLERRAMRLRAFPAVKKGM